MSSHEPHRSLDLFLPNQTSNWSHVFVAVGFVVVVFPWICGGLHQTVTRAQHKEEVPHPIRHLPCPWASLEDVIYTLPDFYFIRSWLLSSTFLFCGPVASKVVYLKGGVFPFPIQVKQGQEVQEGMTNVFPQRTDAWCQVQKQFMPFPCVNWPCLAERGCLEDITLKDNPHLTLQRLDSPFKNQEKDKTYP